MTPDRFPVRTPTRGTFLALLLAALVAHPQLARAAAAGSVEGLRSPAWVERNAVSRPTWVGMRLHAGDRIRTGTGARVLLRLDEGSEVRLGADAEFVLTELERTAPRSARFRGLLDVVRGAFRLTSTALSRAYQRDLDIRISGLTAGIRGTDVWGKAAPDRDIVCLIEGAIQVRQGDRAPVRMDEPLTFYIAPKDAPAEPVAPVSPEQLQIWADEVALGTVRGVMRRDGGWQAVLGSHRTRTTALAQVAALETAGIPAAITTVELASGTWHRVAVSSLSGPEEAEALAADLQGRLGVTSPWVAPEPE